MSQERLKVLEMLSTGKINAEQAAGLLKNLASHTATPPAKPAEETPEPIEPIIKVVKKVAFEEELNDLKASVAGTAPDEAPDPEPEHEETQHAQGPTKLRIRVADDSGQQRVNISIPFKLLKFGISIGERFAPELGEWDWQNLDIDIEDGEGHVRIFME